jgi:hypothetical protein
VLIFLEFCMVALLYFAWFPYYTPLFLKFSILLASKSLLVLSRLAFLAIGVVPSITRAL